MRESISIFPHRSRDNIVFLWFHDTILIQKSNVIIQFTAHFYNNMDLKNNVAGIGAKTWVRQAIRKGVDHEKIVSYCRDHYPNTKESSIRRYITDYKEQSQNSSKNIPNDTDPGITISDNSPSPDDHVTDQDVPIKTDDTSDAETLEIGDLLPVEIKSEGKKIEAMYRDTKIPATIVKLERLPKMITKTFNILRQWGPMKERLQKWNDQDAIQAVADDAQTVIQNRLHISSKNADVVDLMLSVGNLGLSMGLTLIDPNHKPTKHDKLIDDNIKKDLKEKHPEILAELKNIEDNLKNPQVVIQTDQTTKSLPS